MSANLPVNINSILSMNMNTYQNKFEEDSRQQTAAAVAAKTRRRGDEFIHNAKANLPKRDEL